MAFASRPIEHLTRADVPDALFPSDNLLGIPTLDLSLQADYADLPILAWGSVARTTRMYGTWHFYTDDARFKALYDDPTPVVNSGCVAAVEPNFTTSEQQPYAVAIYRTFQKRWLARYWQTQGVRIWVDLNVAQTWDALNMEGVPLGWRAFMTRGYADRLDATDTEWQIAWTYSGGQPLFGVYGGGAAVQDWCRVRAGAGVVWIPETMDVRKGKH